MWAVLRCAGLAGAVACLAPTLGGCAGIMMPLSSWMSSAPEPAAAETTGSIRRDGPGPAAPTDDGEIIRRTIETAVAKGETAPLTWRNEASGHEGTLTRIAAARAANGAPCRDFETTVVAVQGVDLHGGRACQGYTGAWDLLRFDRIGG